MSRHVRPCLSIITNGDNSGNIVLDAADEIPDAFKKLADTMILWSCK